MAEICDTVLLEFRREANVCAKRECILMRVWIDNAQFDDVEIRCSQVACSVSKLGPANIGDLDAKLSRPRRREKTKICARIDDGYRADANVPSTEVNSQVRS